MSPDAAALGDLAASVADGQAIDWTSAESAMPAREQRLVRHLRLVESIAALYRSIPENDEDVPSAPVPGGSRWGRLIVREPIGQGTSCEVFRAFDTDLHRDVALKLLHADGTHREAHNRTLQEARRLARVTHPHVVQVYGAERNDDRVGLWMELVRGESLEQIVKTRGTFGSREAAVIGQEVCSALAAVHGAGLLHRDVKAQNVLRENGGRVVLMDFGTGEELRQEGGTPRLVGTPLYLAPEIIQGQPASRQSDIYSVGVLLFYLASGQFPVAAATMEHLAAAHAQGTMRRLRDVRPDLPAQFVGVVERALDPNPTLRYRTAGEMEAALRDASERVLPATSRPIGRPSFGALLPVAASLVLILGLIVWNRSRGPSVPLTTVHRIAVLPVATAAGVPATLSSDLTAAIIATLGRVSSIRVTALTSVERYRGGQTSVRDVAAALGVDGVLVATLTLPPDRSSPAELRVQLLAGPTGDELWAQTFRHSLTAGSHLDIGEDLQFQSGMAREVADSLRGVLAPSEPARFARQPSGNPDALRAYAIGSEHLKHLSVERGRLAIQAFKRAAGLDQTYAAAHAALARSYIELGFLGAISQAEARAEGLAEANKAVLADSNSSDAYAAVADLKFFYDWDWAGAEEAYVKATDLNPSASEPRLAFARYLAAMGRLDDAIRQTGLAASSDPLSPSPLSVGALMLYFKRDLDGALKSVEQAAAMNPDAAGVIFVRSRIRLARNELPHALRDNDRAIELAGTPSENWKLHRILLLALSGDRAEAREALARHVASAGGPQAVPSQSLVHVALIRDALGDRQAALDAFERAVSARDPNVLWSAVDPRMATLRAEPRFQAAIARIGLPR